MRIAALAGGLAAMALAPAARAQFEKATDEQLQWIATIERGAYTWATVGAEYDTVLLWRRAAPVAGYRRMWVRFENFTTSLSNGYRYRSSVSLDEFDCSSNRSRTVQLTLFANRNLEGEARSFSGATAWTYPLPSSLAEATMTEACKAPAAK